MSKIKKSYTTPECEFISFNFEVVAVDSSSPQPMPSLNSEAFTTVLSSQVNQDLISEIPTGTDYTGTKYVGIEFSEDRFSNQ